jgi:integrase
MPRGKGQLYVKVVKSKGTEYCYFDTGQLKPNGKKLYAPLPPRSDLKKFGAEYAAHLGHRTRRENIPAALSLHKFIDIYQRSREFRELAPSSQAAYNIYLSQLDKAFDTAPADELAGTDVVSLLDSMADRPGAANLMLKVIGALYSWGRGNGRKHVTITPTADIKPMKLGEHKPWDEDLLAAALKSNDVNVRLPTALLYYTGQRIGDVCAMKWTDTKDGFINVIQEKTGEALTIKLHRDLKRVLDQIERTDTFIVAGRNGKPRRRGAVREWLQDFAKLHGHKIVPHGLRKNAVNTLLEVGCTVAQVASVTGQSLQMIEHYGKRRNGKRLSSGAMGNWEEGEA